MMLHCILKYQIQKIHLKLNIPIRLGFLQELRMVLQLNYLNLRKFLEAVLNGSKSFVKSYTGLNDEKIDEKEDLTLPVLPEGEIGDVKIEDDNFISQPKSTEVTSTMIEIVPIAAPKTEQGYKDELLPLEKVVVDDNPLSHAKQMLPPKEDRGSNVLFIFFGILLLVGGAGFFIYINYIDKDFIDNLK